MTELFDILGEIIDNAPEGEFEKWRDERDGSAQNDDRT